MRAPWTFLVRVIDKTRTAQGGPYARGATVVLPYSNIGNVEARRDAVFAGYHVLNGSGEMTGTAWIVDAGMLEALHKHLV